MIDYRVISAVINIVTDITVVLIILLSVYIYIYVDCMSCALFTILCASFTGTPQYEGGFQSSWAPADRKLPSQSGRASKP